MNWATACLTGLNNAGADISTIIAIGVYGSQALGTAGPTSDWDYFAITEKNHPSLTKITTDTGDDIIRFHLGDWHKHFDNIEQARHAGLIHYLKPEYQPMINALRFNAATAIDKQGSILRHIIERWNNKKGSTTDLKHRQRIAKAWIMLRKYETGQPLPFTPDDLVDYKAITDELDHQRGQETDDIMSWLEQR